MAIPKTCIISRENLKNSNVGGFQIIVDARPGKSLLVTKIISRTKVSTLTHLRVFIWPVFSL